MPIVCTWLVCCGSVAAPVLYHIMRYAIAVQETGMILRGGSQRGSRYFINWCFLLVWCGEPHQLGVDQSNKVWLNRREDCLQELDLTIICHPALYLPKLLLFRGEGFLEEVYPPSPTLFECSYSCNSFISPSYTQAPLSLQ